LEYAEDLEPMVQPAAKKKRCKEACIAVVTVDNIRLKTRRMFFLQNFFAHPDV
jgi:hypothetical protein